MIDNTSTWIVTDNSVVTNLENAGTIVDPSGNSVTILGTDGTIYVQGTGEYTITVSSYIANADLEGAGTIDPFEEHNTL